MKLFKIFGPAVEELLRKRYGGDDYKQKKKSLRKRLRDPEVVEAVNKIRDSFRDIIKRYVDFCAKYPLSDRASMSRWERMLTKKELKEYADIRRKIDAARKAAGLDK